MFSIQLLTYCTILNLQVSSLQSVLFVVLVALAFYEPSYLSYFPTSYFQESPRIYNNCCSHPVLGNELLFSCHSLASTGQHAVYGRTQEPISYGWYIGTMGIAGTPATAVI
jgi:hypothetical protein